jgi:hypothetical protein
MAEAYSLAVAAATAEDALAEWTAHLAAEGLVAVSPVTVTLLASKPVAASPSRQVETNSLASLPTPLTAGSLPVRQFTAYVEREEP